MADDSDIRITAWPEKPLPMQHSFDKDEPCPVSVRFEPTPVNVRVQTAERPLSVDMNMALSAREPVPLCISICEPICAQSDYTISLDIFDQPVARVLVRGLTRIFNCREAPDQPNPPQTERCVDFTHRKDGEVFGENVEIGGASFAPVEGELKIVRWGAPEDANKLLFTSAGVRITLPGPCDKASVTLVNHFGQTLNITVLRDGEEVESRVEMVDPTPRRNEITQPGMTEIVVSGGGNEAAVVELCWTLSRRGG